MTVLHLSLLDLVGQNTATPVTATAGDWQHFQDLLKSALDQNAPVDAVKPTAPERQAAGTPQDSNPDSPADAANTAKAKADAATANATQAKSAVAARHIEKRIAARADAASADRKAATQASTASAKTTDTPAAAAAIEGSGSATDPANAGKTAKDAKAGDAGPAPTATMTQDPGAPAAPAPADPTPTSADAKEATVRKSAPDPTAETVSALATTDAAAATVVAALVPAYPPTSPAPAVADGGQSSLAPDPIAPGGLANLLASTTDPMLGDHLTAGTSGSASRGARPADSQTTDPASALFGGGDAAASLAAGVAPVPAAQSENRSAGQESSHQQSHGSSQGASDQNQSDRSGDPQAAPAQNTVTPAPIPTQTPVVPSALLGASFTGSGAGRAAAAITADSDIDPAGATPGLGFGERASAASLTPLRLSETPNSASSPYAATQAPLPVEQVALAIGRLTNGARSFSMQLNPEHLGAVDVRMEVDAKGKTKVAITAERPETLALLKLDSHHLVKALQDSGVSADQASLSFSLREQGSNASGDRRTGNGLSGRNAGQTFADDTQDAEAAPVRMSLSRHLYDIHA